MPKRTKKSGRGKGVLAVLFLTVLGAGALATYVKMSPKASHLSQPLGDEGPDLGATDQPQDQHPIAVPSSLPNLMVPAIVQSDVQMDHPAGAVPDGVKPEVFVMNQTLQSLKVDGVRALGVDIHDRVALMDFNPEIQKGYGTMEEGYLIKAIQMALGQFKDIDKFQIIVDGKPVDSLGNIDLSKPVDVIRPGQKSDSSSSEDSTEPKPN